VLPKPLWYYNEEDDYAMDMEIDVAVIAKGNVIS
jgi:hypothetical protein